MPARVKAAPAIAAMLLTLLATPACFLVGPTDPSDRDAQFCVTQNEGESLLCCPSPGLGCQAAETTQ